MARKRKHQNEQVLMQNAVKTLLANIRFASVDDPVSSIVITSSVPNEGKTTVALNLARAIATSGRDVLLVETDMRRRSLAGQLGVHPSHGLYAVLAGDCTLEEAVVPTKTGDCYFLDAEPNIPNPADILASHRFRKFVKEVNAKYDYVVFDTPPVGTFVDAAVIAAVVDATVLVVRQNYVRRDDMVASFTQLKQADANVIGTVLNYCEDDGLGHYGYYGSYGEEPAKGNAARPARAEKDMPVVQAGPAVTPAAAQRPVAQAPVQMPARTHAHAQTQAPDQEVSVPGIRPVPTRERGHIPPDSTAQLIAGYTPREYTDD